MLKKSILKLLFTVDTNKIKKKITLGSDTPPPFEEKSSHFEYFFDILPLVDLQKMYGKPLSRLALNPFSRLAGIQCLGYL